MTDSPRLFFRALGPLGLTRGGDTVELGKPRTQAVLAMLLIAANDIVPTDRFLESLWPDTDQVDARHTLHVAISDLRHRIEPKNTASGRYERLITLTPGYLLRVGPDEFDVAVAERKAREASRAIAEGDHATADVLLAEAAALWTDVPYAQFTYEQFAQQEIRRLNELKLTIIENLMEAELQLGRHHDQIATLETLVSVHPTRERFLIQLMTALSRSQRTADALQAYERARRLLESEFGTAPDPAVSRLATRIRRHEHTG